MCIIGFVCSCGSKETETESKLEVSENVSETDDNNKEYVIPDIIGNFSEGLAWVCKEEENWGCIDKNGNARNDCNYYIDDFSEGLCMFRDPDAGKYGYLDENLDVKIPAVFDTASSFHHGLAWVEKGETRYYIDKNGNIALDKFFIRGQR